MVKGVETDSKKLKHKKKTDETWLAKDLNEVRKMVEDYIDSNRPVDAKEINGTVKTGIKKSLPFARMVAIILGIIGFFMFLYGIYSMTQEITILNVINIIIGTVFLVTFILFEKYG